MCSSPGCALVGQRTPQILLNRCWHRLSDLCEFSELQPLRLIPSSGDIYKCPADAVRGSQVMYRDSFVCFREGPRTLSIGMKGLREKHTSGLSKSSLPSLSFDQDRGRNIILFIVFSSFVMRLDLLRYDSAQSSKGWTGPNRYGLKLGPEYLYN